MHIHDDIDENDALRPVMVSWFRSVFMFDNRSISDSGLRDMHKYCRILDLGLTGKVAQLMDMTMQRLKAKVVALTDGNWKAAQHMELLPPFARRLCPFDGRRIIYQEIFVR